MRYMIVTMLACLGGATLGAAAMGCSPSCGDIYFCTVEDIGGTGASCPEDPADGPVPEQCGVWVSALLGDDDHPGTWAGPVRTLGKAVDLARKTSRRIYVCGGDAPGELYLEAAKLPPGLALHGGFACTDEWEYLGEDRRAIIAPVVPGLVALTLSGGEERTLITDIEVEAPDATTPGGSSIAVFARDGVLATFRRSVLIAGNGADGTDGPPGSPSGDPASDGLAGNDGADSCTAKPGEGGAYVQLLCPTLYTTGGWGGDGGELVANGGMDGSQSGAPAPPGYGTGGQAENVLKGTACVPGLGGGEGSNGLDGAGAEAVGRLTEEGYVGEAGSTGAGGTPGQGGGGGGGSTGNAFCGSAPHGGAGGGSGASGGCGGNGGRGGQPGGSSFGLAARLVTITLEEVHVFSGHGGRGGNGGIGQVPGQGGLPGLGGLGSPGGISGGCAGGAGGQGGYGGDGGGGHGGHSAAIAQLWAAQVDWPDPPSFFSQGSPGQGGEGGIGGLTDGQAGTLARVILLDP